MEKLSMAIYRRRLAETAARLLIAFIVLALITCPFLVPQNILIIIIGVIALIGSIIVWFLIRNKFVAEHAPPPGNTCEFSEYHATGCSQWRCAQSFYFFIPGISDDDRLAN